MQCPGPGNDRTRFQEAVRQRAPAEVEKSRVTALSERKTRLCFTTSAEIRYRGKLRPVVIEAENGYWANARLARTRQRYPFSWEAVFVTAAKLFAEKERARRKRTRAQRKAA